MQKIILIPLILCIITGIICITVNLVYLNLKVPETKIIYKYIPKTFDEDQRDAPMVSDVFKSMFVDQTPWVNSIMDYDRQKQEAVNKYYISQI